MNDQGRVGTGTEDAAGHRKTPWPLIVLAWTFVGVPWAWGVTQTVAKSMALFQGGGAAGAAGVATQPSNPPSTQPAVGTGSR